MEKINFFVSRLFGIKAMFLRFLSVLCDIHATRDIRAVCAIRAGVRCSCERENERVS